MTISFTKTMNFLDVIDKNNLKKSSFATDYLWRNLSNKPKTGYSYNFSINHDNS